MEKEKFSDDSEMEFGEICHHPKYESSIPEEITQLVLGKEKLPDLPNLRSSIIEDFIADKINNGIIDPETIAKSFINDGGREKLQKMIADIKAKSRALDWKNIFTDKDAKEIQKNICAKILEFGFSEKQIDELSKTEIEIVERMRESENTITGICVNKLQIVRKAMDYADVFKGENDFNMVVKALVYATTGHELGHKINDISEFATNRIEDDPKWKKNGDSGEKKQERFAEFWGQLILSGRDLEIIKKEWLVHFKKVNDLWDAVRNYNENHDGEIDLFQIFYSIRDRLHEYDPEMADFLNSRKTLYSESAVENFVLPYPRDIVEKSLKAA